MDRFLFERETRDRGANRIAGLDEAGRGPLAGPVVAAAVVLPIPWLDGGLPGWAVGLNDSKQLTERTREHFFELLTRDPAVAWSLAEVDAGEIDRMNIRQATHRAMLQALEGLRPPPDHVLIDGLPVEAIREIPQTAIVGGDGRSYSIAAASILAKVSRDRMMKEYDRRWPGYGFAAHKGYGTAEHLQLLRQRGPSPIHRRSFAPLKPVQPGLFDQRSGV